MWHSAASAITLRIGEETTSLEALQNGVAADGRVYDLQGRMIENPGKGIYIKNNKKIIIKYQHENFIYNTKCGDIGTLYRKHDCHKWRKR